MKKNSREYVFFSEHLSPNGHKSIYSYNVPVSLAKERNGGYDLILGGKSAESINGKQPEEFDLVMSWLGNSLYPLTVRMDDTGKAKEIIDIDEVRRRYTAEGLRIMEYYEQDPLIVKYVEACIESTEDDKEFLQSIARSNLYQLATICMDIPGYTYHLADYPCVGDVITFRLSIADENEEEMLLTIPGIEAERKILSHEGKVYIHKAGKETFDHIQLILRVEIENEGYYTRKLELKRRTD